MCFVKVGDLSKKIKKKRTLTKKDKIKRAKLFAKIYKKVTNNLKYLQER